MIQMLHHLLLIQGKVLEGEPQVEEGVLDDMPAVPAPSGRESVPAEVEEVPAAGNSEEDETMGC